jgi:hypothetical protein
MFRKRLCREGTNCNKPFCLFAHTESELVGQPQNKRTIVNDYSVHKKFKIDNNEVVLNRVDESAHSIEDLKDYSSKYGRVLNLRRLNRGKFLVIFDNPDSARRLLETTENILGDSEITKFFNVNVPLDQNKRVDLPQLFQDQKELLDKLSISLDYETLEQLKNVTFKIRHHVLATERKSSDVEVSNLPEKEKDNDSSDVENSLYYNMFAG